MCFKSSGCAPRLHSPIFGLMSDYIVGLKEYSILLQSAAVGSSRKMEKLIWI